MDIPTLLRLSRMSSELSKTMLHSKMLQKVLPIEYVREFTKLQIDLEHFQLRFNEFRDHLIEELNRR